MYDTILVPTDGSSTATVGERHAIDLASAMGSTVHAVYVIEEGGNPWRSESMDDQMDEARAYGQDVLDDVVAMGREEGVDVVTGIEVGPDVWREIHDYVEDEGIEAVVMGTGYRGKIGAILGSTAERVIRTAGVPVTVVQHGTD